MAHLKKRNGHLVHTNVIGGLGEHRHLVRGCIGDPPLYPNCCAAGPVTSVTLSGATACASGINGTFSLTPFGSCQYVYDSGELTPVDPCGSACYTDVDPSFGFTRYWQPTRYTITVTLSSTTQDVEVVAVVSYTPYRIVGPDCNVTTVIPARSARSTFRRTTCQFGTLVRDGGTPTDVMGLPPTTCTMEF